MFDMSTVCGRCVCEFERQHNFQNIIIEINRRICIRKIMLAEHNFSNTTKVLIYYFGLIKLWTQREFIII